MLNSVLGLDCRSAYSCAPCTLVLPYPTTVNRERKRCIFLYLYSFKTNCYKAFLFLKYVFHFWNLICFLDKRTFTITINDKSLKKNQSWKLNHIMHSKIKLRKEEVGVGVGGQKGRIGRKKNQKRKSLQLVRRFKTILSIIHYLIETKKWLFWHQEFFLVYFSYLLQFNISSWPFVFHHNKCVEVFILCTHRHENTEHRRTYKFNHTEQNQAPERCLFPPLN